jgi:cytochrome c-type biogenesis protein CcmH/NrfF
LGTGIALLPERAYSFALAKLPAEAATGTVALLFAMLVFGGTSLSAQAGMGGPADPNIQSSHYARNDFERQMQHEIVCTCGSCGHQTIAECRKDPCGTSHELRSELAALIDEGKNHDEIIQTLIARHGGEEMLGAPIDKGFSRLAWLFPYLIGATSAVAVGVAAVRWTRKPDPATDAPASIDSALEERIDDELRDLD